MTEDRTTWAWVELGAAIRAAREARGLRQVDLADLAGVSEGTIQNLENGDRRPRIPPSLAKVEPHLGWAPESGLAILRGETPTTLHEPADDRAQMRRDLPLRIVDELESSDPLLDSTVIQLPGTDGARMTVVVRGRPDATPEEIQEALLAWRRTEQELRRLPGEDEPRAANGS
ncbi:helix-turn-helix transcriptional regulator [Streptomyces sp. MS06]|uniref:helix-turn-helix transcriptional regulator n=1 Tax=Streptomyces sp. MS06 TaxID=3385974 RepID=UPI0039A35B2F